MSSAREQILGTLRSQPGMSIPPLPDVMTSASSASTPLAERIAAFTAILDKLGAPVDVAPNMTAAATRITAVLAKHNASSLALSDAAEVLAIADTLPTTIERIPHDAPRESLLRSHAGLSTAQWAVAETGTLALVSRHERHRLATLLPDLHIALLPASRLLGTLGDAFVRLGPDGAPDSPTITFVTGPSRTADIELELIVGVHGPKALHIVIVADA
ncbi:MAG: L-lactate dehydrogenase complex protein LldG [Planctomycetota bacterium]|jgi:L-lactate dehydrogenase complex protein LldG